MPTRDVMRLPWLCDELVTTDAARVRLRRWAQAGHPSPPDHAAAGLVGPEPGMFNTIRATLARLPPPVRHHVAHHVVFVAIGERARGVTDAWPTVFKAGTDEGLQLVVLSYDSDLESLVAHEVAHTWLGDIQRATRGVRTLEGYQDPPDFDALAVEWGAGVRLQVALNEWRTANLARAWGFAGLGARPEKYESRIREARREIGT